jgi:hypothetical protein
MRTWVLLWFFLLPAAALAQESTPQPASQPGSQTIPQAEMERLELLFKASQVFYQNGKYEEALSGFAEVYSKLRVPSLLFNMGQCYRLLGRKAEAVAYYHAFLEQAPETPYRQEIEKHIVALTAPTPAPAPEDALPGDPASGPASAPVGAPAAASPDALSSLAPLATPSRLVALDKQRLILPGGLAALGTVAGLGALAAGAKMQRDGFSSEDALVRRLGIASAVVADLSFLGAGLGLTRVLLDLRGSVAAAPVPVPGGAAVVLRFSPAGVKP